jgi:hypothetical protein
VLGIAGTRCGVGLNPFTAFDKEGGKQLSGSVKIQNPGFQILFQKITQEPIQSSDTRPIAAKPHKGEGKPQGLESFVEIPGRGEGNLPQQGMKIRADFFGGIQVPAVPDLHGFDYIKKTVQKFNLFFG